MRKLITRILWFLTGSFILYLNIVLFDFVIYPIVILMAGLIKGFFIMVILSFASCLLFLLIYNYLKKDIFALEWSKKKLSEFVDDTKGNRLTRFFRSLLKHSRIFFFIFLSFYDPFIATVFMRKNYEYTRMSARDYGILALSIIIGDGIWAPTVFAGISFVEFIYRLFA